jgi:predicted metal-dependent HD superfamily phosphohydrolase
MRRSALQVRWRNLLGSFGAAGPVADAFYTKLADRYTAAGRYYHTLEHITDVLETIDQLQNLARHRPALEFAAWFHDVIYDTRARDNEEKSAAFAEDALRGLRLPEEVVAATTSFILRTKTHWAPPEEVDARILIDADLAILGASEARYAWYAEAIRREYAWVPEDRYRAGRRQVLEAFLARERIYHTEPMFQALEAAARRNLSQEVESLG